MINSKNTGKVLAINGKRYLLTHCDDANGLAEVVGPKGGVYTVVKNLSSGKWRILTNDVRPKAILIKDIETWVE